MDNELLKGIVISGIAISVLILMVLTVSLGQSNLNKDLEQRCSKANYSFSITGSYYWSEGFCYNESNGVITRYCRSPIQDKLEVCKQ